MIKYNNISTSEYKISKVHEEDSDKTDVFMVTLLEWFCNYAITISILLHKSKIIKWLL